MPQFSFQQPRGGSFRPTPTQRPYQAPPTPVQLQPGAGGGFPGFPGGAPGLPPGMGSIPGGGAGGAQFSKPQRSQFPYGPDGDLQYVQALEQWRSLTDRYEAAMGGGRGGRGGGGRPSPSAGRPPVGGGAPGGAGAMRSRTTPGRTGGGSARGRGGRGGADIDEIMSAFERARGRSRPGGGSPADFWGVGAQSMYDQQTQRMMDNLIAQHFGFTGPGYGEGDARGPEARNEMQKRWDEMMRQQQELEFREKLAMQQPGSGRRR